MPASRIYAMLVLLVCNRSIRILALVLTFAASGGCEHGPTRYQVSGHVFYKDGSVPQGEVCTVHFLPSDRSPSKTRHGASGAFGTDGAFELMTRKPGDGVDPGEYTVTFAVRKSIKDPVSLIAEKYTNPHKTPYKVTVDRDRDDLKFEIEPRLAMSTNARLRGAEKPSDINKAMK